MQNNESSYLHLLKMCVCICMYANLINSDDTWNKQTNKQKGYLCLYVRSAFLHTCLSVCVCVRMCASIWVCACSIYAHVCVDRWVVLLTLWMCCLRILSPFPPRQQHRADHIVLSSLSYSYTTLNRSEEKESEHEKHWGIILFQIYDIMYVIIA